MEPRLIKGIQAEYVPAKWSGENTSGVRVVGKTVLVLMDECSTTTSGGVSLPEDLIERMSMAAETGVLVACSPGAFLLNEDMTPWSGEKPKAGDRVYVQKYSGQQVKGRDGKMYRLMDYGCIGATYEPETTEAYPFRTILADGTIVDSTHPVSAPKEEDQFKRRVVTPSKDFRPLSPIKSGKN
jgi:chaperonin GroES